MIRAHKRAALRETIEPIARATSGFRLLEMTDSEMLIRALARSGVERPAKAVERDVITCEFFMSGRIINSEYRRNDDIAASK